jgi:sugar phosphate isomerase/epimerase
VIVACSTLCFSQHTLADALRVMREMHFAKADLAIHPGGKHLAPAEVSADVGKVAQKLKTYNLPFTAFHVEFDAADTAREQLRAICRLARLLTVPVVTVPAAAVGANPCDEVNRLTEMTKIAAGDGVILTVETRLGTITQDVSGAVELCKRVGGLGLTLDPSHYLCGPHPDANIEPLFPYVRHVRLRDSNRGPNHFQVRVGQGEIEYSRIIASLERFNYERAMTVDIRDTLDSPFPVDQEVRKLKFLLESLV